MFVENIEIIYKWGFDGVSGQKKYKHRYSDANPEDLPDSNLLMTYIVPIQMYGFQNDEKVIIWQNPRSS